MKTHFSSLCLFMLSGLLFLSSAWNNVQGQSGLPDDPEFLSSLSAVAFDEAYQTAILCAENYISYLPMDGSGQTDWVETPIPSISAAINYNNEQILFFQGDTYYTYTKASQQFSAPAAWPGLPTQWNRTLSAVSPWGAGKILFVKGIEYVVIDMNTKQYTPVKRVDQFPGWNKSWSGEVRAVWKNGSSAYFLIGNQIATFNMEAQSFGASAPKSNVAAAFPDSKPGLKENATGSPSDNREIPPMFDNSDAGTSSDTGEGWSNYDPERDGRYRTDYPDYEKGSFTQDKAFTSNTKVPGYDWLGVGINITKYNPIFPTDSWTSTHSPILTTLSSKYGGNKGDDALPWGANSRTISSVRGSLSSKWIKSYQDFVNTFKIGGGANVGVGKSGEQIAGANFAGSFQQMVNDRIGKEFIYHVEKTNRSVYSLAMDLFWRDAEHGMCRQKLSTAFEDAIQALPARPSQQQCYEVIETFGTHISTGLTMGGVHLVLTEVEQSDFESTRMSATEFQAAASGSIKKVTAGAQVNFSTSTSATDGGSSKTFDRKTTAVGGYGHEDKSKWEDKLAEDPVAISITLVPLTQIMTNIFFPNDANISTKKTAMFAAINSYIKENTPPPVKTEVTFFDVETHLAEGWDTETTIKEPSGKVTIVNNSHYDISGYITYELYGKKQPQLDIFPIMHAQKASKTIPSGAKNVHVHIKWKEFLAAPAHLANHTYSKNGEYTVTATGAILQKPTISFGE